MNRILARKLQEEDEKNQMNQQIVWNMVKEEIRAEIEKKALLDVELKRLEENAKMAELIRSCDERIAHENKAKRMTAFRRYM